MSDLFIMDTQFLIVELLFCAYLLPWYIPSISFCSAIHLESIPVKTLCNLRDAAKESNMESKVGGSTNFGA